MALPFAAAAIFVRILLFGLLGAVKPLGREWRRPFTACRTNSFSLFNSCPSRSRRRFFRPICAKPGRGRRAWENYFGTPSVILCSIALPLVAGMVALATGFIVTFSQKPIFALGADHDRSSLWCLICRSFIIRLGALLNASHKQNIQKSTFMGIIMCMSIILNLIFIPHFGVIASACAALDRQLDAFYRRPILRRQAR